MLTDLLDVGSLLGGFHRGATRRAALTAPSKRSRNERHRPRAIRFLSELQTLAAIYVFYVSTNWHNGFSCGLI